MPAPVLVLVLVLIQMLVPDDAGLQAWGVGAWMMDGETASKQRGGGPEAPW